jgi:hypothetical protein
MYQSLVRQAVLLLCLLGMEYGRAIAQPVIPDAPILQALVTGSATTIKPVMINGRPYVRPTNREQFIAYLKDSYGLPAFEAATFRSTYAQLRGKPEGWGQDWPGFGQRFGTAMAVSAINGNVRYGMEMLFHEDMRYIPCHGCTKKKKIENALLAEITARHDTDGHRFFTLTPTIADFSGPIITHSIWYPGGPSPIDGVVAARLVFATRIGGHLFREFVLERRHKDPPLDDVSPAQRPAQTPALKPQPSLH